MRNRTVGTPSLVPRCLGKNVLPAHTGSTILKIGLKHFKEKSHFFDVETAQLEPVLVMFFGPTALQFNHFPFYPLHAPQAGPH